VARAGGRQRQPVRPGWRHARGGSPVPAVAGGRRDGSPRRPGRQVRRRRLGLRLLRGAPDYGGEGADANQLSHAAALMPDECQGLRRNEEIKAARVSLLMSVYQRPL